MQEIQGLAWPLLGWILEGLIWCIGCRDQSQTLFPILYFPAFTNLVEILNHPCGHPAVASDLTKTLTWVKEVLDRAKEEVTQAPKPGETK